MSRERLASIPVRDDTAVDAPTSIDIKLDGVSGVLAGVPIQWHYLRRLFSKARNIQTIWAMTPYRI
jgi:hypothetical protein